MNTDRKERNFEAEKREWRYEVGRAILSMGEVEHITMQLIAALASDPLPQTVKRMRFMDRKLMLEELCAHAPGVIQDAVGDLVNRMESVANKRNILAHNPLYFVVDDTGEDDFRVMSIDGKKVLTLAQVRELADAATNFADDAYLALELVLKSRP